MCIILFIIQHQMPVQSEMSSLVKDKRQHIRHRLTSDLRRLMNIRDGNKRIYMLTFYPSQ